MLGAYVCRQCRTRNSRHIPRLKSFQRQPRATFFSLQPQTPHDEAITAQPQHGRDVAESNPQSMPNAPRPSNGERRPHLSRYSALVQGDAHDRSVPSVPTSKPPNRSGPAVLLAHMLRQGDVIAAWTWFEKNYKSKDCEALVDFEESDVPLLRNGRVFETFLVAVNAAFCAGRVDLSVTPTMLLFRYEQLGLARDDYWARLTLGYLTHHAMLAVNAPPGKSVGDLPSLLSELLSVWRLFFQVKGSNRLPLDSISTEWNLPAVADLPELFESKIFHDRLQDLHPRYICNATTAFCAVYLYNLSDALAANEALQQKAAPFIRILGRLLAGSFVDGVFEHRTFSKDFQKLDESTKREIIKEIDAAPRRALRELGSAGETLGEERTSDPAANLELYHLKRIARSVESRSSADILELNWTSALEDFQDNGKPAIPPRVYNAFLSGFMILFRAHRSVEVWNHMVANGVNPDLHSWVALLEGCSRTKDSKGFDAMWMRMLNTGLEPDNYAWTSRIHGLFSMRRITEGLAALNDMGKRWLTAEDAKNKTRSSSRKNKSKPSTPVKAANNCTKPSIEVINGAVSALTQLRTMPLDMCLNYIQKILQWASGFQIKSDVITYNSLIGLYLRHGDSVTAFNILRQMENDGIVADVATHTMLLTAGFDHPSFSGLSNKEQAKKVISIIDHIENAGIALNQYVYSSAIDKLLKQHSNYEAVHMIIAHMRERNLTPGAHLYTSLVTFYFEQSPPAIPAVDAIVRQIFTSYRTPVDIILFDRILEGYAAHNEVSRMLDVLHGMSKHGRVPGWVALSAVIQALLRNGNEAEARAFVRDIEFGKGIAKGGVVGGSQAELQFFAIASQARLVAWNQTMA